MAIHVQDKEAEWLVREFARRRGLGITAAVKTAILEATSLEQDASEALGQKIEPILQEIRSYRQDGKVEKAPRGPERGRIGGKA